MSDAHLTSAELIAPCGLNCRFCYAFDRPRNPCPGCRGSDAFKPKSCLQCAIKSCPKLAAGTSGFCYDCDEFPCPRLARLDKRYRLKYATDLIANLRSIQTAGLASFVENENVKWTCPACGAALCIHHPTCPSCGSPWH